MLTPAPELAPRDVFESWFAALGDEASPRRDAMILATADRSGRPSARVVLFKGWSGERVRLFTNYESRKAAELRDNPHAALVFYWPSLERQVRIEGSVERLSAAESDDYFAQRPRGSQLSASVSPQSTPVDSHAALWSQRDRLEAELAGRQVPRPEFWGGFGVLPRVFEFWINRDDRFHERFRYTRTGDGWNFELLAP